MKTISALIFCLAFAAYSEDSQPMPLSADDEKFAASLLAALADNDFDQRVHAQEQLSKLVFSDTRKGAAWVGWVEDAKKKTTDTEVLSRLPSNVASRFKLCGYYKAIGNKGEIGTEIHILGDGTYKLFSGRDDEERGSGTYTVHDDGRADLSGTFTPIGGAGEEAWECKASVQNEKLITQFDNGIAYGMAWTRIPEFPSEDDLLKAVRACGKTDPSVSAVAWATIRRLPAKSRAAFLQTHFADADVPVDNQYLQNLAVWSAKDVADALKQLEKVAMKKNKGDAFLCSFVTLLKGNPDLSMTPDAEKRFAESLECMSDDMGEIVFHANIDWKRVPTSGVIRAVEALVTRPGPDVVSPYDPISARKSEAFTRYYELKPDQARQIILAELRSKKPHFDYKALTLLPDKELPQLTEDFRRMLDVKDTTTFWNTLPCIERYGSAELLPEVKAWYEAHGQLAGTLQSSALRFMMKHDREMGFAGLRHALTFRRKSDTRCFETVVPEVLSGDKGEDTKKFLIDVLFDPDDSVAEKAADLLVEFPDGMDILKKKLADKDNGYSGKFMGYCQLLIKSKERQEEKK
jgi:hypothetical protein